MDLVLSGITLFFLVIFLIFILVAAGVMKTEDEKKMSR